MRSAFLLGIIVSAAGCFKPALEREIDIEPDMSEVADTEDGVSDILDTVAPDIDTDTEDTSTEVEVVECQGATGQSCDDGDPCTRDDRCGNRGCEGIPYRCDDGLSCTEDRCDGAGGCTYPLANGACLIGGTCVAAGQVNADDPCRVCAGGQAWSPNDGGPCEDGDTTCTLGDTCEGFVCVGGPRPSDAATDWAMRPVTPHVPSNGFVQGVGRAGLNDVLIAVETSGSATYESTTGMVTLDGNSVAVLRRTAMGLVNMLTYDGFTRAQLRAFAPPSTNNLYGLAVRLEGAGLYRTQAMSVPLEYEVTTREVVVADAAGALVWRASWSYEIDDVAMDSSDAGLWVGGDAWSLSIEQLGGQIYGAENGAYLVKLGHGGTPRFAMGFRSTAPEAFEGDVRLCATSTGVVASTTFVDGLTVDSSINSSVEHPGPSGPIPAPAIVWVDDQGATVTVQTPFRWTSRPPPDYTVPAGPFIVDCSSEDALLFVAGKLTSATRVAGYYEVDGASLGGTLMRLNRAGDIIWSAFFDGVSPGLTKPTIAVTSTELIVVWSKGNTASGAIHDASGRRFECDIASTGGVAWLDFDGKVLGNVSITESSALILSAARLPNRTLVLGGVLAYTNGTFHGADAAVTVETSTDFTPFVVGLNTNRGLECALP